MGQAKRRGTFEDRRQQSIDLREKKWREAEEKERIRREELHRKAVEWWDSLTPEQQEEEKIKHQEKKRRRQSFSPIMATMLMAAAMPSMRNYRAKKHRL